MQEKRQLEVLFQISRALVGKRDLDGVLHEIVTMTAELINSKICALMILDEKRQDLAIRATQSLSTAYRDKPPIKVGQSVSGRVVVERRPIQVADVTRDSRYGYPEIARQEGLKSLLSVPMMMGEKVIGILNCYTDQVRDFKKSEIQLVQTIANQAAIAIEHMRVVTEEAEARLALETKQAIDKAKRILMKRYRMNEEQSHRFLQKMSMDRNQPQKAVAEAVILSADLELAK